MASITNTNAAANCISLPVTTILKPSFHEIERNMENTSISIPQSVLSDKFFISSSQHRTICCKDCTKKQEEEVSININEWRKHVQKHPELSRQIYRGKENNVIMEFKKALSTTPGYQRNGYIDPESLKRAVELGATEEEVKRRTGEILEAMDDAIKYSVESEKLHATYFQRAVDLGVDKIWLKERIKNEIQEEKEKNEREEAYSEIKETVRLLDDPNTLEGEHQQS
jgi:hypothetical protein